MMPDALVRLSRKLRMSPLADDSGVAAWHDAFEAEAKKLPAELADRFLELMRELRATIPDDFSFWVSFEFEGVNLSIEYEDGNTGTFDSGKFFRSYKSMMKALHSTDWDERRSQALQQGGIFDEMLREADDRPANIPSSAEAATRMIASLSPALEALRSRPPQFAIIGAQSGRIETMVCDSDHNLVGNIGDMMACSYDILAVFRDGAEMAFEQLEELKQTVAESLGPISRAKAERRFFA